MKRTLIAMILCSAATAMPTVAFAADAEGAYSSQRPASCRELVYELRSRDRTPVLINIRNWISGYITAYNRQTAETFDILGIADFEAAMHSVENFCKARPLENLAAAMEVVTEDLYKTRHQTKRQAGR